MRAVRSEKGVASLIDVPPPEGDGVLIRVASVGICGSDLHQYRGNPGPRRPPLLLGHEAVVTVAGRPGRFVLYPLVSCGECEACVRDEQNLCHRRGLLGFDRPGVFADSLAVDADAHIRLSVGLERIRVRPAAP